MIEASNQNASLLINRLGLSDLTKTFISIKESFVQDIRKSIEILERKECESNLYASIIHPLISIHIEPFIRTWARIKPSVKLDILSISTLIINKYAMTATKSPNPIFS
jgi:hypothetical protein